MNNKYYELDLSDPSFSSRRYIIAEYYELHDGFIMFYKDRERIISINATCVIRVELISKEQFDIRVTQDAPIRNRGGRTVLD